MTNSPLSYLTGGGLTAEERLLTRMAFDAVSAALLSAQGTDAGPNEVLTAARRATVALARAATTRPGRGGPGDQA